MALPVNKTATGIVTEALKKAGFGPSPSAALILRAETEWLYGVINKLSLSYDMLILEETKITIMAAHKQRYALPEDFDRATDVRIYESCINGIAQSGTLSTITLALTETITEADALSKLLFIYSGTAKNQMVRITAYDEDNFIATVTPDFDVLPINGDGYAITKNETITEVTEAKNIDDQVTIGIPSEYHIYGRTPKKELFFDSVIDSDTIAAIKCRYLLSPYKIDLLDNRMTEIYNEYYSMLVQGVKAEAMADKRDKDYHAEMTRADKYTNLHFQKDKDEDEAGNFDLKIE